MKNNQKQLEKHVEVEWIDEDKWITSPFISLEQWLDAQNYVDGFVAVESQMGMPDIYIYNGFVPVLVGKATEEMMEKGYVGDAFMGEKAVRDIIEMSSVEEQIERETNEFGTRVNGKWW